MEEFKKPEPVMQQPIQPPKPAVPLNVDDMVIPTLGPNPGANQMSEYPDGSEPHDVNDNIEDLSPDIRKNVGPMIDAFGEMTVRKIFTKTWQLREEALNEVEDQCFSRNLSDEDSFVNAVGAVRYTINDKMANVS